MLLFVKEEGLYGAFRSVLNWKGIAKPEVKIYCSIIQSNRNQVTMEATIAGLPFLSK